MLRILHYAHGTALLAKCGNKEHSASSTDLIPFADNYKVSLHSTFPVILTRIFVGFLKYHQGVSLKETEVQNILQVNVNNKIMFINCVYVLEDVMFLLIFINIGLWNLKIIKISSHLERTFNLTQRELFTKLHIFRRRKQHRLPIEFKFLKLWWHNWICLVITSC